MEVLTILDPSGGPEGAVTPAATGEDAGLFDYGSRREGRLSVRNVIHDLRPSVVTGGAATLPLLLLFFLNMADELGRTAYNVLVPEIRNWFGVNLQTVIVLGNLSALIGLLLALPLGFITDRWNRVRIVAAGCLLLGGFTFATGLAPTVMILAAIRFGAGFGKQLETTQFSLLPDYYPPKARGSVFAFHSMANPIGKIAAPLLVAAIFGLTGYWQAPFLVFGLPTVVLGALILARLREPTRGNQERRALGASEEAINAVERPPSFGEAMRAAWNVRTARRIWYAIPFLTGSLSVILPLTSVLFADKFGLGVGARGVLSTFNEPVSIVALMIGGGLTNRLIRFKPGRVMTLVGLLSITGGAGFLLMALVPFLPVVVFFYMVQTLCFALLAPAIGAVLSMVVPPRVRGVAGAFAALWAIPGLVFGIVAGGIGDVYGISAAMVMMTGVFCIGGLIISTAGSGVEPDIRAAFAASMAAFASREAREAGRAKLLVCRDVDVSYSNVQVLFNVDFDVEEGEIVALLGTNGAGKSTLLRAISGLTTPGNGAIFFDGEDITFLPANEHASRGIILVNGGRGVFPSLTVEENLRLAGWLYRDDAEYLTQATEQVLEYFPRLRERLHEPAGNLSGGEQQMLTLSQAFLSKPRLLMIDELSLGLAPVIVDQLLQIVRAIHAAGTTVVLVEQSVNVALTVAERAVYMEKGEVRFSGPTAELLGRNDVLKSVFLKGTATASGLGSSGAPVYTQPVARYDGVEAEPVTVLDVRDIQVRFGGVQALSGASLTVDEGKILGLIGPNGAGKTTLFDVISGFVTPNDGAVLYYGEDITTLPPDGRARLGVQRSFQDARLFPNLTVAENLAVALERHVETKSAAMAALRLPNVSRSERKIDRRVDRLVALSNLGDYRNKFVRELSTGTRRIVDLACILAADPKVILLDEPSSGVAQRETEELGPLLLRIRFETGCAMLLIEHDMGLISSVSDELLALDLGRNVTRGAPEDVVEHPDVVASYLGASEDAIRRSGELPATRKRRT